MLRAPDYEALVTSDSPNSQTMNHNARWKVELIAMLVTGNKFENRVNIICN